MADKVKKTNDEWRSELTPRQFAVTREKATEAPFSGEYEKTTTPGLIAASAAARLYSSPIPSLTPDAAGPASRNPRRKAVSQKKWIAATAWFVRKSCAPNAMRIWGMCLTTGQGQPAFATASTRPH